MHQLIISDNGQAGKEVVGRRSTSEVLLHNDILADAADFGHLNCRVKWMAKWIAKWIDSPVWLDSVSAGQWSSVEQINTFLSLCNSLTEPRCIAGEKPIEKLFWRLGGTNDSFKTSPQTLWHRSSMIELKRLLMPNLRAFRSNALKDLSLSLSPIDRSLSGPNSARV